MSVIPGGVNMEAEEEQPTNQVEPGERPAEHDDDDDAATLERVAQAGTEKEKALLAELIGYRKSAREAKRELATIKPQLAQMEQVKQQVEAIRPYAEMIRDNPALIEQANRGTKPSATHTEQPVHDEEARDLAQEMGWYNTEGQLDVARGQRWLKRLDDRATRRAQAELEPLRRQTANTAAVAMRQRVESVRDSNGMPIATKEGMDEAFQLLDGAPELVADPRVAMVAAILARGFDSFKGRTPKARATQTYDEPLYTESTGRRGAVINEDLQRMMDKTGLTAKDIEATAGKVDKRGYTRLE